MDTAPSSTCKPMPPRDRRRSRRSLRAAPIATRLVGRYCSLLTPALKLFCVKATLLVGAFALSRFTWPDLVERLYAAILRTGFAQQSNIRRRGAAPRIPPFGKGVARVP